LTKYKLYNFDDKELFYIDKIPLHIYLDYLSDKRMYNKEMAVDYTRDIYDIDIADIVGDYHFKYSSNVYEKFKSSNPIKTEDNRTRKYFNSRGRNYFIKFLCDYSEDIGYDALYPLMKYSVVHHIHPLEYSEDNDIENLIQISDFSHKLLHNNPFQHDRKICFKSLDYLGFLYSFENFIQMVERYHLESYYENPTFGGKVLRSCIDEEMSIFYSAIGHRTTSEIHMNKHQKLQKGEIE
jgi:hypothetical protein